MNRFDERMLDRDLEETLGGDAPSDLRERILNAHAAPQHRRTGRVRALPVPAGRRSSQTTIWGLAVVTLSIAAAFVVLWSYVVTRPNTPAPDVAGGAANSPAKNIKPAPTEPAPKSNAPEKAPRKEETPQPLPVEPRPLPPSQPEEPSQPRPVPPSEIPKRPDEVEKPQPPGETPKETQPKPTEAPKVERARLGTVLALHKGTKLQSRVSESDAWKDAEGDALLAGTYLKISHPADLTLGDALVRFEGVLRLEKAEGAIRIDLIERNSQAWCDNLGGRTPLILGLRELSARMNDGAAHFEANSSTLNITCVEGSVEAGDSKLASGQFATLSGKGFSKPRALTLAEQKPRLISEMAPRKLLHEEFSEEPAGKLYGGTLKDGAVKAEGAGTMVAFDLSPTLIAVKDAKLRLRYRVTGCTTIYLQFLGEDVSKQYGMELTQRKQGQWLELELKLDTLPFDAAGPGGEKMPLGLKLGKFQCYVRGEKNCTLEIDWLEVVRE
jgi:hypothetical protein